MQPNSELVSKAMAFNIDHIVSRYVADEDIPNEVAQEHEKELKRFLTLCAMNDGPSKYGMRGPVDHLWHTFIMFTRDYQKFCDQVGGRFIHHVPETKDSAVSADSIEQYENFLNDYKQFFGEEPPAHVWPRVTEGQINGAGCDGCSGCGVE